MGSLLVVIFLALLWNQIKAGGYLLNRGAKFLDKSGNLDIILLFHESIQCGLNFLFLHDQLAPLVENGTCPPNCRGKGLECYLP